MLMTKIMAMANAVSD